ncbi:unnamed protein product [Mytilus edulis]|uniref:RanBP2-type domain-containing protein n=1 Tax=Mytilus edulis TaxID=6550 RepID=A0A8S3QFQ0_MYTED|nr:unnamed protein product [Mytilus edulis]
MHKDAPTKSGRHFYAVELSNENTTYTLGLQELADGHAETYAKTTDGMISDINDVCTDNPNLNIMSKIKNFMTDRSATEEKTNRILMEPSNNNTINSFKCSVHPLIQFWDVCDKNIKEIEKGENFKLRDCDKNRKDTYINFIEFCFKTFLKMGQETQQCQMEKGNKMWVCSTCYKENSVANGNCSECHKERPQSRNSKVDGYKLQRRDRTDHGGGIATFMRADIPARRRLDIECKTLENIVYEITLDKTKWLIYAIYRPPSMANNIFYDSINILLDKGSKFIENYMVIGDLNYDFMVKSKSQILEDICDIFDLSNIVKKPTCYMKGYEPSLVDVILTNRTTLCFKTLNFNTGVSDCHHMISTFIKGHTPNCVNSKTQYRSFKSFNVDNYINDLDNINFYMIQMNV